VFEKAAAALEPALEASLAEFRGHMQVGLGDVYNVSMLAGLRHDGDEATVSSLVGDTVSLSPTLFCAGVLGD
jgi:hypothetical protein